MLRPWQNAVSERQSDTADQCHQNDGMQPTMTAERDRQEAMTEGRPVLRVAFAGCIVRSGYPMRLCSPEQELRDNHAHETDEAMWSQKDLRLHVSVD